jgi:hypothetical protein
MLIWQAILGLLAGGLILIVSSERAVDQLIKGLLFSKNCALV